MKESIKRKLPIVLVIITVLLLAANFMFKGNSFLEQKTTMREIREPLASNRDASVKIDSFPDKNYLEQMLNGEKFRTNEKVEHAAAKKESTNTSEQGKQEAEKKILNLSISDCRIILSGTLLVFSLLIIGFNKKDDSRLKWAFGVIGSLIGFWMK